MVRVRRGAGGPAGAAPRLSGPLRAPISPGAARRGPGPCRAAVPEPEPAAPAAAASASASSAGALEAEFVLYRFGADGELLPDGPEPEPEPAHPFFRGEAEAGAVAPAYGTLDGAGVPAVEAEPAPDLVPDMAAGGYVEDRKQAAMENNGEFDYRKKIFKSGIAKGSGWTAKSGRKGVEGADYLYELGKSSNQNTNVDVGQTSQFIDSLFTMGDGGLTADIADGSLREGQETVRNFGNLQGDYYIAPAFLDAVAMHIVKNHHPTLKAKCRVPLILGIWGGKGQGKSFQTELCFKKMGVQPVIMSAGELEDKWAGKPAKLIRERYRQASEQARVSGKMGCLMINDIDAGVGVFHNTQRTVNMQMVLGTLMNLCDDPEVVPLVVGYESPMN